MFKNYTLVNGRAYVPGLNFSILLSLKHLKMWPLVYELILFYLNLIVSHFTCFLLRHKAISGKYWTLSNQLCYRYYHSIYLLRVSSFISCLAWNRLLSIRITTPSLLFVLLAMAVGCYLVNVKNREKQLVLMGIRFRCILNRDVMRIILSRTSNSSNTTIHSSTLPLHSIVGHGRSWCSYFLDSR